MKCNPWMTFLATSETLSKPSHISLPKSRVCIAEHCLI